MNPPDEIDFSERPLPFTIGPHGGRSYYEQTVLAQRWAKCYPDPWRPVAQLETLEEGHGKSQEA